MPPTKAQFIRKLTHLLRGLSKGQKAEYLAAYFQHSQTHGSLLYSVVVMQKHVRLRIQKHYREQLQRATCSPGRTVLAMLRMDVPLSKYKHLLQLLAPGRVAGLPFPRLLPSRAQFEEAVHQMGRTHCPTTTMITPAVQSVQRDPSEWLASMVGHPFWAQFLPPGKVL